MTPPRNVRVKLGWLDLVGRLAWKWQWMASGMREWLDWLAQNEGKVIKRPRRPSQLECKSSAQTVVQILTTTGISIPWHEPEFWENWEEFMAQVKHDRGPDVFSQFEFEYEPLSVLERSRRASLLEEWKTEGGRLAASQIEMNEKWDVDEAAVASAASMMQESAQRLLGITERLNWTREQGQGRHGPLNEKRALAALLDRDQQKVSQLSEQEHGELVVREMDYFHICEVLNLAQNELITLWYGKDERHTEAVGEMRRLLKQLMRLLPFWAAGIDPEPEDFCI
jgi:hypothetical protein